VEAVSEPVCVRCQKVRRIHAPDGTCQYPPGTSAKFKPGAVSQHCFAHFLDEDGVVRHCLEPLDHWGDHRPEARA
jgi:hypothetical protein